MQNDKQIQILAALHSEQYKKRLEKVHRFEEISGGGIGNQIKHLLAAPNIYIPYVVYAKLGLSYWFLSTMTLFWGRKVRIALNDYDALILSMYGGLYGGELNLTKFIIKNLKPEDVFYDIGANLGFYTYLASDLCKEVHVFEPMPQLTGGIKNNIRLHDQVTINPVALSDKSGSVDFYSTESTMTGTINPSVAERSAFKKITVQTTTLDEYVKTHTKPTFLKIDAEGAEAQIITGGLNFFSSNAPVIAMEIWGKNLHSELSMQAAEKLRELGYRSFRVDDKGDIQEVTGDLSQEIFPTGGDNFIFKKS